MIVNAFKTHKITQKDTDIFKVLDEYLPQIQNNSVVIITSKIISICEGRIVPVKESSKDGLVKQEADLFIPKEKNQYNVYLTIKNKMMVATAGIDESNAQDYYVLWPSDPQKNANEVREYLIKKNRAKNLGVIISDSKTSPLKWGITGAAISHSGFKAINDKIGTPDIFGKPLKLTQVNVSDALASAAVLEMGEANEQTPLAVITDIPYVEFQDRNPTQEELDMLYYDMDRDLYSSLLTCAPWEKGRSENSK